MAAATSSSRLEAKPERPAGGNCAPPGTAHASSNNSASGAAADGDVAAQKARVKARIAARVAAVAAARNGNGQVPGSDVAERAAPNGNGQVPGSGVAERAALNGNGHVPGSGVAERAALNGNGHVPGSGVAERAALNGNGQAPGSDVAERRRNPDDGKVYCFEEFKRAYERDYLIEDLRKYWRESMSPVAPGAGAAGLGVGTGRLEDGGMPAAAAAAGTAGAGVAAAGGVPAPPAVAATSASTAAAAASAAAGPQRAGAFGTVAEWLGALDESGNLLCFEAAITERCGPSVDAVLDRYAPAGSLDKAFFQACGVKKIGHKRMFERWFESLPRGGGGPAAPPPEPPGGISAGPPSSPPPATAPAVADEADRICALLQSPAAKDRAEDLPIGIVEAFYQSPGSKLCEVGASGDARALAMFLALCGIIGIDWREARSDVGETVAEAAGVAGHGDLARALVRQGLRRPLSVAIAYGDASVQEVEAMVKSGAVPDLYACAAAAQVEDEAKRRQLLAILGDPDKAATWLQEALSGPSREWVAALRTARAYGVELRC